MSSFQCFSAELVAGWAPYFAERMDYILEVHSATGQGTPGQSVQSPIAGGDMRPRDYFRRTVYLTFMRDRSGVLARDLIGVDHLMWATDYPHMDSTFPNSREMHDYLFEGVPEADKHKIIAANATAVYGFA